LSNLEYSIIILTYNEELNLPRILSSIRNLQAKILVVDSGSTDKTLEICRQNNIEVYFNKFENHPKQWDYALKNIPIFTPWIIGLDADQTLSYELLEKLLSFKDFNYKDVNGIYFNRKYLFKGQWIKHGGHYPKYLLKMFRAKVGHSDLTQNMDHRFIVTGETIIWKKEHLIEENLNENQISFWIDKHNRYSTLLATENRQRATLIFNLKNINGTPNERKLHKKQLWDAMPLYIRPVLYFTYRLIFQLGILDNKNGIIFHFLQAFWFRLLVDIKIEELKELTSDRTSPNKFILTFLLLFGLLYGFNTAIIGLTTPDGLYSQFIDDHMNYIRYWRKADLQMTAYILTHLNCIVTISETTLITYPGRGFKLVYSCLGYSLMSMFSAFVIAFEPIKFKWLFLFIGLISIQAINIARLTCIAIFWHQLPIFFKYNHHDVFNGILYFLIGSMIYLWIKFTKTNHLKGS
jgi:exosortase/archaeosortase family protein